VQRNDEAETNETSTGTPSEGTEGSIDLAAVGSQALDLIHRQATEHPLRTVGIAMGVGYVLGGGIPKVLVRLGMLAAGKALSQAATIEGARALAGLLQGRTGDDEGSTDGESEPEADAEGEVVDATEAGPRRNGHRRRRGQQARAASQA
jgi:hypothetical protein